MTGRRRARHLGQVALGTFLLLRLTAMTGPFAERARSELTGSCYCKAAGELRCVSDQTEGQCSQRCAEELCDEWFWLERRPCWNWGYGG